MSEENIEQVQIWFEEHDDEFAESDSLKNKLHECRDIASLLFMASKLNENNKDTKWFIGGEHDVIYIGESFNVFEDFTEEDVITALRHGISLSDDCDGFQMYASL